MYQYRIYVILLFFPILGVYHIVKGILYYIFAEEKTAVVVEKHIKNAKRFNSPYIISVYIEDLGETITIPMDTEPRLNHKDIGAGDKITVWYLKKFNRCIYDRSQPIKDGLIIIALAALGALIFIANN